MKSNFKSIKYEMIKFEGKSTKKITKKIYFNPQNPRSES
jgi:hypothetical protein